MHLNLLNSNDRLIEIEDCIKPLPALCSSVNQVREEHVIHSQYAVAMENLKHIFTVPESVEKTRQWISEGKLLHAHQSLTDLENSRDDLLFELHRLPSHSVQDRNMLKVFFFFNNFMIINLNSLFFTFQGLFLWC